MTGIARTAKAMISTMTPVLRAGEYVFVTTSDAKVGAGLALVALATHREEEGLSLILSSDVAREAGFDTGQPMRCITLSVFSALDGVGLTAAVASALAENGIPCNMVAAFHHDHAFVPSDMAERALTVLRSLQRRAADGA